MSAALSARLWSTAIATAFALAVAPGWTVAQTLLGESARPELSPLISQEEAVVVSIRTSGPTRGLGLGEYEENLPVDDMEWPSYERGLETTREEAVGSGFIIGSDGYILTNAHVVIGADDVIVRLADKRRFLARVIGFDRLTDVALIKIDASSLPVARAGDPSRLRLGEWVVAIGSPFGLDSSVTAGIVSARKRYVPGGGGIALIQTDVAINPGSSGSPLFNLSGEVIGMNSMMMSANGGYSGVSLALPIDIALKVAKELRDHGFVVRSQVGAQLQEVTADLARSFGLGAPVGALVVRVQPGGPAAQADLRLGDVILGIEDGNDESFADLQQRLAAWPPGKLLELRIWRRGAQATASLIPTPLRLETPLPPAAASGREPRLGLTFSDPPPAQEPSAPADIDALRVVGIRGAARRAGVHLGDRILAVNDVPVASISAFDEALARTAPNRPVALLILRRSALNYIAVDPAS
jgi:serine protease Do